MNMEYTLKIKDERYFNNGNLILPFLKDEGNHPLGEKIKEWLQSKYDLTELVRKNKHGVKAEALNKALRAKLEIFVHTVQSFPAVVATTLSNKVISDTCSIIVFIIKRKVKSLLSFMRKTVI